ncbi:hypothetical protein R5R35_012217 [Gryllus longicercus]|uniref:Uncharacterized protein n=1 Tax=Gryllus longicercus TaxID=2509291 RepID=A0AAN9VFR2_9ORTH
MFEEDSWNQVNQIPRMYSQQSGFQSESENWMGEKKYVHKRQAQTCENGLIKVPKLNTSHLCPQMYHSSVEQCVVTNTSNTTHSDCINYTRHNNQLCTHATSENATFGVAQEQAGHSREKQMNKLYAQKIAIGI